MRIAIMVALLLVGASSRFTRAAEIDESTFKNLHASLQPSADEPWRTIPWKIALLDAREEAAREGKPIFIWAMDGHPLGCT